jgi:glucose-6-phosphate 1-dehydrogenase
VVEPQITEAHLFIVLGGKGDLMGRKLLPALFSLHHRGQFPRQCVILGASRDQETDDQSFQAWAIEALTEAGITDERVAPWVEQTLFYQSVGGQQGYDDLKKRIIDLERAHELSGNRIFYLALPPGAFPGTIAGLGEVGLNQSPGWVRLVVEKPFGRDLSSAVALNALVHQYFTEPQIYRIDHYLGKETVQNLLVFRFANAMLEPIWNRDRVARVEITVAESLGIEGRGGYYDQAGAMRDMIQNHLTQVLTLTAMEVPGAFEAEAIRNEKVKVLRSIERIGTDDLVFGQYTAGQGEVGYLDEEKVPAASTTETFVALRLEIKNWRWQGVPFLLRTGKHMPRRTSQVVITFRDPPVTLFPTKVHPNRLVITLQPDEGFDLSLEVKAPGSDFGLEQQRLRFRYSEVHGALPDGYETLLLEVMNGDPTLFVRADEVEAAWELFTPVLELGRTVYPYEAGSWGPCEANRLLADGERATK